MAKKKKANSVENRENKPLTKSEIEKFSKLIEEIGTHKKKGFVMIFETETQEKKNGIQHTGSGLCFTHCARSSYMTAVARSLRALGIDPLMLLLS